MKYLLTLLACASSFTCLAEILPGSPEAAQAMAAPYVANRFISVAKPDISGDQAVVKAMFNGQECTLNLLRDPNDRGGFGWRIYGSRCRSQSPGDLRKWYTEHGDATSPASLPIKAPGA